jgi:FkbM family methyltransferase
MLKTPLTSALKALGLYDQALHFRRFLQKHRYRHTKRYMMTMNGVTVQFSTEDRYSNSWFYPRYAEGGIHEKTITEMLVASLQSARCFVDAGAHLGWYTCIAARHMPQGKVVGFEMDSLNFALLKHNIAINQCTNAEVYNLALSDTPGVVNYKRDANRPSPEFHLQDHEEHGESTPFVSVQSVSLDDFFISRGIAPDVVKIDVEGAEMKVLTGMRHTLRVYKPILFLELHPFNFHYFDTSTSEVLSFLADNRYDLFEIESMRSQKVKKLKPIQRDAVIDGNAMLYAAAQKQRDGQRL